VRPKDPLETNTRESFDIRSNGAGTAETSYYGALKRLFNVIGKSLKPKVECIINPKNRGAGLLNGGSFLPRPVPEGRHETPPRHYATSLWDY